MLKRIKERSKLAVIAPAFPPDQSKLKTGIEYLKNMGFEISAGQSLQAQNGYLAGPDQLRLEELHRYFADPETDGIICARGGWGCLRLLDKIDYELIRSNPKMLVGYSDVTTLQLAIWKKCRIPSLSGPMVAVEMGNGILAFTEDHFWKQINNDSSEYYIDFSNEDTDIWINGNAEGTLLGGCLSMVSHQLGTEYSPDYSGAILFIEDVGEEPYKIDRYLAHLKQAGVFDKINGLILGNFLDCEDDNESRNSPNVTAVLAEYFKNVTYPVIYNFPYGHGMKKVTMPIGVQARINTKEQTLIVANPFVAEGKIS